MSEVVLKGPEGMVNALTNDDTVSRQTIITKEGRAFDVDAPKVVIIKGDADACDRAKVLAKENGGSVVEDGAAIIQKVEAEENEAASGMGALFG